VQYAARIAGFKDWFDDYALLGDDIVIGNKQVAEIYLYTMVEILGVEINLSKSLKSNNGTAEFAKRLVSGSINYSPVGAKNIAQSLKSFALFPDLLRDFVSKGGMLDNAKVKDLISTLTYNISKVSNKNLSSILYVIIGPFGFVSTGESRFGPQFTEAGTTLSPYDMKYRVLSYALDHLIPHIKDVIREDYAKDWEKATRQLLVILKSYRNQVTVSGFVDPTSILRSIARKELYNEIITYTKPPCAEHPMGVFTTK